MWPNPPKTLHNSARTLLLALTLALTLTLALSGCTAPFTTPSLENETEPVDFERGQQLFQQTCRVCHSLADANAAGTFGPDLDQLQPDADRVRAQIKSGGGGMPGQLLAGADANTVARYVAEVAGRGVPPEEQSGQRGSTRITPNG